MSRGIGEVIQGRAQTCVAPSTPGHPTLPRRPHSPTHESEISKKSPKNGHRQDTRHQSFPRPSGSRDPGLTAHLSLQPSGPQTVIRTMCLTWGCSPSEPLLPLACWGVGAGEQNQHCRGDNGQFTEKKKNLGLGHANASQGTKRLKWQVWPGPPAQGTGCKSSKPLA